MVREQNELIRRIVYKYGSLSEFAKEEGHCYNQVLNLAKGNSEMTKSMMKRWADMLDVNDDEFYEVFIAW